MPPARPACRFGVGVGRHSRLVRLVRLVSQSSAVALCPVAAAAAAMAIPSSETPPPWLASGKAVATDWRGESGREFLVRGSRLSRCSRGCTCAGEEPHRCPSEREQTRRSEDQNDPPDLAAVVPRIPLPSEPSPSPSESAEGARVTGMPPPGLGQAGLTTGSQGVCPLRTDLGLEFGVGTCPAHRMLLGELFSLACSFMDPTVLVG